MDEVTQKLEDDGVAAFSKSFETLMAVIEARRAKLLVGHAQGTAASLPGGLPAKVARRLKRLDDDKFAARLWAKDPTLWTADKKHRAEIRDRLGWLTAPDLMESRIPEMLSLAAEARDAGYTHAALLGMGGSSSAPRYCASRSAWSQAISTWRRSTRPTRPRCEHSSLAAIRLRPCSS
jgi:transaldolase/glucose-6-phosphate isomerase